VTRPQGEPTHYLPLWRSDNGAFVDVGNGWRVGPEGVSILIPAERVTVAPEPYTPKAGDRVLVGSDVATIIATEPDRYGRIAVRWADAYDSILPDDIEGPVQ